jgi:DNA-binding transcriptional ArsR family regulator
MTEPSVAHEPVKIAAVQLGRDKVRGERRTGRFLKGPIPWDWVIAAAQLPGKALAIGLCLWRLSGAKKSTSVVLSNSELAPFGIDRPAKSRALAALEKAGLIEVARKPGRWPTVTLLGLPGGVRPPKCEK